MPTTHTISILVSNRPGVLSRISAIFSRRAFNIDSLVVSPALDGRFSRMTITAEGDPKTLDQIIKQVSKLIDVIHASEHDPQTTIEKELALIKIKLTDKTRGDILQIVTHFHYAQTIDITDQAVLVQITGNTKEINLCIGALNRYGILEMVRTGKVLMSRGQDET